MKFSVFIVVFPNVITVQTTVTGFAVGGYLALGNIHDLSAVVLALVSKHNDGKRLTGLGERDCHPLLRLPSGSNLLTSDKSFPHCICP